MLVKMASPHSVPIAIGSYRNPPPKREGLINLLAKSPSLLGATLYTHLINSGVLVRLIVLLLIFLNIDRPNGTSRRVVAVYE
jgi:hypothetical protein